MRIKFNVNLCTIIHPYVDTDLSIRRSRGQSEGSRGRLHLTYMGQTSAGIYQELDGKLCPAAESFCLLSPAAAAGGEDLGIC